MRAGRIDDAGMPTVTVTENSASLEPVTADPFIADLDAASTDTQVVRVTMFAARLAASPHRRIFD